MIKRKADGIVDESWIADIRDSSAEYLLHYCTHYTSAHVTNERYLISLLVYAEAATDLNVKPDNNIVNILLKYLAHVAANEKGRTYSSYSHQTCNQTVLSIVGLYHFCLVL